jgi:glycosyltransferase involved in cell wall biosynthesis
MPKVSVVIPSYNAMTYLPETLESVLGQTFADFEVLIINDGSSDHIVEWAAQIGDDRVKLISQENKGLPGARNTGIAEAQGEFIAFLDADDLWEPTKLEKQVYRLNASPEVGLIHTWMLLVDEKGKSTGRVMTSEAEGNAWEQVIEKNVIACPSVVVRRSCFETVGVFDCNLNSVEDWDMWIRIAKHYPFALIREPLSYYRQLPNSMSKNCQVMEKAFHIVIEKAFKSASPEMLFLKNRSYGYANLCLAWKALQSSGKDYKQANQFRERALNYHTALRFSSDNIRLSLAILMVKWFGPNNYSRMLSLAYSFRRNILSVTR